MTSRLIDALYAPLTAGRASPERIAQTVGRTIADIDPTYIRGRLRAHVDDLVGLWVASYLAGALSAEALKAKTTGLMAAAASRQLGRKISAESAEPGAEGLHHG